tara:strand:+ start:1762 stop:2559 length:798 start_codon:yes stop_codon:yes gene_type:complete
LKKNNFTIYIPSKGRHEKCLTADLLQTYSIRFYIVIEPQDLKKYLKKYLKKQIVVLDKNNKGIAYVRNFIKKHSISKGEKYHWQIDDNIRFFRKRIDNKNIKINPSENFTEVEEYLFSYKNIGALGLKHTMYAWSAKDSISFNQQIYSCGLFNNSLDIWWRDNLIEDTDYSLQILFKNYCTVMFNRLIMDKAASMAMKGGNTEISHGGEGRRKRSEELQKQWPGIFELTEQYGRVKVKPNRIWQKFKQRPVRYGDPVPIQEELFI